MPGNICVVVAVRGEADLVLEKTKKHETSLSRLRMEIALTFNLYSI